MNRRSVATFNGLTWSVFFFFLLLSSSANAWFFFIPGGLISKIGDGISGAEGENCVKADAKVGDVIRSLNGNTAKIKSLSGTSSRCTNQDLPIRALIEYTSIFQTKAKLNVPDEFEQKPLTDTETFQGNFLKGLNPYNKTGLFAATRKRDTVPDLNALLRTIAEGQVKRLEDATSGNDEQTQLNGMRVWRFEVTGKLKGIFGQRYTYLYTMIEGDEEYILITAWSPVDDFPKAKETFNKISASVSGIKTDAASVAAVVVPAQSPAGSIAVVAPTTTPSPDAVQPPRNGTEDKPSAKAENAGLTLAKQPAVATDSSRGTTSSQGIAKSPAVSSAEDGVADNPDKASAWNRLGSAHLEEKNYEKAIAAYNEALKRNPKYTEALFGLGSTYFALGNKDKGRELYFELKKYDAAMAAGYFKKYLLP